MERTDPPSPPGPSSPSASQPGGSSASNEGRERAQAPRSEPTATSQATDTAANEQPAQPHPVPFQSFLSLLFPGIPLQQRSGEEHQGGPPIFRFEHGPDGEQGAGMPRDGVFVFVNFGPANPASSSNPAKAAELLASLPGVDAPTLKRVDAVCRAESEEDEGWNCGICLESEGAVKALPCNHLFHADCLEPWFSTHLTCPTCRMQLDPLNTLSNHDPPLRTRTMRPAASGSNTPSARSTPYPARSPQPQPLVPDTLTTTIIFGGPFHSSPRPLGADIDQQPEGEPAASASSTPPAPAMPAAPSAPGAPATPAENRESPSTDAQPDRNEAAAPPPAVAPASPMQTDTPPLMALPRFFFFGDPPTPPAPAPSQAQGDRPTASAPSPSINIQPRIIFFGTPPAGEGGNQQGHFPFPPVQPSAAERALNAPTGSGEEQATTAPPANEPTNEQPAGAPRTFFGAPFGPPPNDAQADGPNRFRFGFRPPQPPARSEPPAPARKTITLDQWLHARERNLGWRCDGPVCGIAPSEDDVEFAGAPQRTEMTVPIYSTAQPYFTPPPPEAGAQVQDFTILACSHRWHRSCLEIAARSGGYWRAEGERVWVRCMACRSEGWVHSGGEQDDAKVTTTACT